MKISTKKDKNSAAVVTSLTITGGTAETWKALGMQALVVKLQGHWRKNGIPAEFACNVDEFAPGTRHAGISDPVELAKQMSPEDRAALIEKLKAMK